MQCGMDVLKKYIQSWEARRKIPKEGNQRKERGEKEEMGRREIDDEVE